ncbi:TetR/AcrR family transcriptional regulator, partial [Nocardioides hankookensis]
MSSTVERGRRLAPDDRREQLLLCAERLFGERPYAQVSTTDIAREAGIARGLLNHYFGDKRGLYLEVVRRAALLPTMDPARLPTGTLEERVDISVAWFLDSVEPHRRTYLTVRGAEGVGEDAEIAALIETADDTVARRVLEMVGV